MATRTARSSRWGSATARSSAATRSSSRRRPRRVSTSRQRRRSPRARGPARPGGRAPQRRDGEFLLDPDGDFWFLEVNTRLQVEHGITELVSGVDIVREQLRIAAGEPLIATRSSRRPRAPRRRPGHAIEVRITAEDPSRSFAPTPGRVGRWVMPSGPGRPRRHRRSSRATASAATTTTSSPSSWSTRRIATRRSTGWRVRSARRRSAASRRRCRSTGPWRAAKRSATVRSRPAGSMSTGTATQPARPPSSGRSSRRDWRRWTTRRHRTPGRHSRPMTRPRRRRAARRRRLAAGGTRRRTDRWPR